jgi:hypothetical protein
MDMADDFDPYRDWLGLDQAGPPGNHYRLLGLAEFESDPAKIARAADEQMRSVRKQQTGPRGKLTQKLLNEISAAKLCLLNQHTKKMYDAVLTGQRAASMSPDAAAHPVAQADQAQTLAAITQEAVAAGARSAPPQMMSGTEDESAPSSQSNLWLFIAGATFCVVIAGTLAGYWYLRMRQTQLRQHRAAEQQARQEEVERVAAAEKQALANAPPVVVQEGSGDLNLPLSIATLSGELTRNETSGDIRGWSPGDAAIWRFKAVRPDFFRVEIVYSTERGGGEWKFIQGNDVKTRTILAPASPGSIVTDEFPWRITRGGEQTLELRALDVPVTGGLTLHSLRFIKQ